MVCSIDLPADGKCGVILLRMYLDVVGVVCERRGAGWAELEYCDNLPAVSAFAFGRRGAWDNGGRVWFIKVGDWGGKRRVFFAWNCWSNLSRSSGTLPTASSSLRSSSISLSTLIERDDLSQSFREDEDEDNKIGSWISLALDSATSATAENLRCCVIGSRELSSSSLGDCGRLSSVSLALRAASIIEYDGRWVPYLGLCWGIPMTLLALDGVSWSILILVSVIVSVVSGSCSPIVIVPPTSGVSSWPVAEVSSPGYAWNRSLDADSEAALEIGFDKIVDEVWPALTGDGMWTPAKTRRGSCVRSASPVRVFSFKAAGLFRGRPKGFFILISSPMKGRFRGRPKGLFIGISSPMISVDIIRPGDLFRGRPTLGLLASRSASSSISWCS